MSRWRPIEDRVKSSIRRSQEGFKRFGIFGQKVISLERFIITQSKAHSNYARKLNVYRRRLSALDKDLKNEFQIRMIMGNYSNYLWSFLTDEQKEIVREAMANDRSFLDYYHNREE